MSKKEVQIGQLYRSTDARWLVWQVAALSRDSMRVPHAKIRAVSIKEERTVACSILVDPRRFQRVDQVGE